ncbi:hypothetical protein AAFF_G00063140 [Aldrovandia affinis]|uniref:Myopalladin n=1 Tax=Aldrovandia affinis TaxID=143900 RepID=A0AAD7RZI0_9TELE|nr:hypothetical protein AAFF_G00063140 [Aldrovandia affinis]
MLPRHMDFQFWTYTSWCIRRMQENSLEPSASLAQILRESFLADAKVQRRHSEMSARDGSPRHLLHVTHPGKAEDAGAQEELPDLSAFLSSEELHKSVNLARQAIGQRPQEETPHAPNASPEKKKFPQSHHPLSPDRQTQQPVTKENIIRNNRSPIESHPDLQRQIRNTPYGPETQSKKEFLNKAADFIEELSSLFKANSSKRIRPRTCKAHRSRSHAKAQADSAVFGLNADDRERTVPPSGNQLLIEADDREGPTPPFVHQLDIQTESCLEEAECGQQEGGKAELCESGEVEGCDAEGLLLPDAEQSEEPVVDPPRFIQKLKSREVPEGSKVQLDCIVSGFPVPEVRWFCEGKELENSPDIQILSIGELHSLIIAEAFEEDTGRYSCFASNFYGTDSTSAEIYIEGASSSDSDGEQIFVGVAQVQRKTSTSFPVLPPSTSEEDSLSTLPPVCPPAVQYPKQEVPTPRPAQEVSTPLPAQVSAPLIAEAVSIPLPVPLDALQTALQEVTHSENFNSYPQGLDGRPIMAAPVFTKSLQDLSAFEGQLVVLECRVKGVPSPRVDWYREGTLIDDSPDFRILQKKPRSMAESEEICTLVIAEAFPEDSGTFTCTAVNKYGIVSSIAYLKVKAKESHSVDTKMASKGTVGPVKHKVPESASPVLTRPGIKPQEDAVASELRASMFSAHPVGGDVKPRTEPALPNLGGPLSSALPPDRLNPKLQGSEVSNAEPCPTRVPSQDPPPSILKPRLEGCAAASNPPATEVTLLNHAEPRPGLPAPEPAQSCLKPKLEGVLVNHNEPRSSSRVGLRVHFKLPEDEEESEASEDSESTEDPAALLNKGPPPILAKPKLDSVQLQILHNQVLLEQQQDGATQSQPDASSLPTTTYHEPQPAPMNLHNSTATPQPQTAHTTSTNMTQSFSYTTTSNSTTQSFNYTRPKEFLAAQALSPVSSLSPTESPVPFLNAMAAQLPQRQFIEVNSPPFLPTVNQFTQSPKLFPTRVLQSPTSPPSFVSSPPPMPHHLFGLAFPLRTQSPPQASSPTPSGSTPSPIQNPVAFLSSVLPSLPTSPPPQTNAMGLPRGAPIMPPQGLMKKAPRTVRSFSDEEIRDSKDSLVYDLEKKLRFKGDATHNGQQEYRLSNFEQRLMSEIEFRLERTPVEESDDEVQHDEIPTGKCIAPIFDKKLRHFRAMEGVAMTFTCKVVGIPIPKVYWFKDGKQILKKNVHYKKMREGDGTCALHIESTTNDDDGNYTVMAANPQGRISCSGHLIVQTGPVRGRLTPMIHSQRVRSRVQEAEDGEPIQERFFRPHFLQAPGDMVAHEGRLCRLDCKVSGLPNPDLMWLRNGIPILPDFYHRMLVRENGIHSLLIDPLKQSDAGTYTCIATNKAGQNSFCLELSVVERELKRGPMFVERLQNTGIAEGSPVRLECRVLGMPPPVIYWKKDNDTIPPMKGRLSMHQDATGYVCLLIQPSRKEDAGWYTVSAKNEAGIVSCTARLDIYAQWHQQIPLPMKATRAVGSRYAALASQGLDILSAFPTMDNSPILFASTPAEAALESEEL